MKSVTTFQFLCTEKGKAILLSDKQTPQSAHGNLFFGPACTELPIDTFQNITKSDLEVVLQKEFERLPVGTIIILKINNHTGSYSISHKLNKNPAISKTPFKAHFNRWLEAHGIDEDCGDYELSIAREFYEAGITHTEKELNSINVQLDETTLNELEDLIQMHQLSNAINQQDSVHGLILYLLNIVAEGSRNPDSLERQLLISLGLITDHPNHQVNDSESKAAVSPDLKVSAAEGEES